MTRKINKEKSVICANWCDPVKLGTKGTFVDDFNKPEDYFEGTLFGIRMVADTPFLNTYGYWYKYFVPEKGRVLEEEYKPFTKMEQLNSNGLSVGNSIFVRRKVEKETTYLAIINVVTLDSKGHITNIGLGLNTFSAKELFNDYEWCKSHIDNEWRPFGVKDERN